MGVKSTRLRFISSKAALELSRAVDLLPFKVELKGAPTFDGERWFVWFVIPDEVPEFKNIRLKK